MKQQCGGMTRPKRLRTRAARIQASVPHIVRNDRWLEQVEARRKFPVVPYKQVSLYPSDFGACLRKLWFARNGYLIQGRETGRREGQMEEGNEYESRFVRELLEAQYPNLRNIKIGIPDWNVSGKADVAVLDDDGGLLVVECKATNSRNFKSLVNCDVANLKDHQYGGKYLRQLHIYMRALKDLGVPHRAKLVVFCFDDGSRASWDVDEDPNLMTEIDQYYKDADTVWRQVDAPPIPTGYSVRAPPCLWCPAKDLCW